MRRGIMTAGSTLVLMVALTAQASAQQHMIGGVEVPQDRVQEVQAFCEELAADGGPGGPGEEGVTSESGTSAANAAAVDGAGDGSGAGAAESTAQAGQGAAAGGTTADSAAGETNTTAGAAPSEDTTTTPEDAAAETQEGPINWEHDDIAEIIDFDMCVEGGFVDASAAQGMSEAGPNNENNPSSTAGDADATQTGAGDGTDAGGTGGAAN